MAPDPSERPHPPYMDLPKSETEEPIIISPKVKDPKDELIKILRKRIEYLELELAKERSK